MNAFNQLRKVGIGVAVSSLVGLGATAPLRAAETWHATHTQAHDVRDATHVAEMRSGEIIEIAVSLQLRNKSRLDEFTSKILSGANTKPMTQDEFMSAHAPAAAQVNAVVRYLRRHGFRNVSVADNRLLVTAEGTAGAVKTAFKAELHQYNVNGRMAHANVTPAEVPEALSTTVAAVLGLQTVHLAHTMHMKYEPPAAKEGARAEQAQTTSERGLPSSVGRVGKLASPDVSPQVVTGINPTQFSSIYGATGLPSATNATIGIITNGNMTQTLADLRTFAARSGYPAPTASVVQVGNAGTDTAGTVEWDLDSQSSLAAAGGTVLQMLFYTGATLSDADLAGAFNKAVADNRAKVINVSLGECERDANSSGFRATSDAIFQSAVAQGQTFSVSSGDSGSYECGGSSNSGSYPAVSPYVMAIGGTTLSTSGGTWVGETVWSCNGPSDCPQSASGGTGGGVSLTEAAPSWQIAAGVLGGSTKRGVPDISFDASPNSGALIVFNGGTSQIGGTSLSAPLFTGFYSRIQSANNNTLPFPAATLYQGAASHPSWFHDVTSGGNGGYAAKTGWDYTTGFGSLIVGNFATAFGGGGGTGGTPVANFTFTTSGLTASFVDTSTDSGGTISAHAWTFGDGATSNAGNPTHTYAAAGSYTVSETVTNGMSGKTSSKSATVTVSAVTSSQLLGNGGFETGAAAPWSISAGALCTNAACSGQTARSGVGFVWLDGYGRTHTDTLSQSVAIPAGKTKATLSFALQIDTAETSSTVYDRLTVRVLSSTGAVLATLGTFSNINAAAGYAIKSFDMTAYVGKTVTVSFTGTEDSSLETSFVLDDITLTVQ